MGSSSFRSRFSASWRWPEGWCRALASSGRQELLRLRGRPDLGGRHAAPASLPVFLLRTATVALSYAYLFSAVAGLQLILQGFGDDLVLAFER